MENFSSVVKPIDEKSSDILKTIIKKCEDNDNYFKYDKSPYMPLHIEKISKSNYSLAHTYTDNGDCIFDPEIVFIEISTPNGISFYPKSIRNIFGTKESIVEDYMTGDMTLLSEDSLTDLVNFSNMWLNNIDEQFEIGE